MEQTRGQVVYWLRLPFELEFHSSISKTCFRLTWGCRSNWDQKGKNKCCTFLHTLLQRGTKQVHLKISLSNHFNSVLHFEVEDNLQPHQPISTTEEPPLISSSSGWFIKCVWLKQRLHRICPQTAQEINTAAALEQVKCVRFPSVYLNQHVTLVSVMVLKASHYYM